jgi:pyruvate kinase
MDRKAKIVATLGPASHSEEMIRRLVIAGIDVARLNFSHGSHEEHAELIRCLRMSSKEINHPVAILQDLQGPKIRVGHLPEPLDLVIGDQVRLYEASGFTPVGEGLLVPVVFPELFSMVHGGERILLDDGRIELLVAQVTSGEIMALVKSGGRLTSHKGFNLPGIPLDIPGFTEKDKADLAFGMSQHVDMVAISFVRTSGDVEVIRQAMSEMKENYPRPLIIAKLERPEALENLDAILLASDGVMVARGDLGVEMPPERVPTAQKRIIHEANRHRKIVITATQMLESMITNPLPTRAEASDVANAIFDGTDAVMLSGETANGDYPEESVLMMDRIVREAEGNFIEWGHFTAPDNFTEDDAEAITRAACELAHDLNVAAIAVFTQTGRTALIMSKTRPLVPIFAFTPSPGVLSRLSTMWGVRPVVVPMGRTLEEMVNTASNYLVETGIIEKGKQVVFIGGYPVESIRPPNMAMLHTLGEVL